MNLDTEINLVREIFKDVRDAINFLEEFGFKHSVSQQQYDLCVLGLAKFQRTLELLLFRIKKLEDSTTKPFIDRMSKTLEEIKEVINFQSFGLEKKYPMIQHSGGIRGVRIEMMHKKFPQVLHHLSFIQNLFFGFLEDVNLVRKLLILPIERKLEIRILLLDLGFDNVVKCLKEAQQNIIDKHPKDCADRLREALEKLTANIIEKLEGKPSSFAANMNILTKKNFIDIPSKIDFIATYSYLSQIGPHGRLKKELTDGDVNYVLDETYRKMERLLEKLKEYELKPKED